MTTLNKPVTRRLANTTNGHGRNIIVQLMPGLNESIRVREAGRRKWYEIPLSKVVQLGARIEAESNMKLRKEKRKEKKKQRSNIY